MKIFNPVIGNEKINCRCKDCFHGFWLRSLHDEKLKCYCELSHSILFSAAEKVSLCSGAEDNLNFSDFLKQNIACTHCQNENHVANLTRRFDGVGRIFQTRQIDGFRKFFVLRVNSLWHKTDKNFYKKIARHTPSNFFYCKNENVPV